MKFTPARFADFLKRPDPAMRAMLLYGPDSGLVRERADALIRAVCPDLKDPFRVADLPAAAVVADPARLADELAALSLIGGRRVVRLRDAGDAVAGIIAAALERAKGDTLLVVEAGELPPRSSLRKYVEEADLAAALPCYADTARDLAEVVRETLGRQKITVDREALDYLVAHLGGDRLMTRSELQKLVLYVGDGGRVGLTEAIACIGDSAALSLDDAIFAAADGDVAELERALFRCFEEGESPITVLRATARHLQRLHLARAQVAAGRSADDVVRGMRPPVFYKLQERFKGQIGAWTPERLASALRRLTEAELDAKRSALPQETVVRHALLAVARTARPRAA